MINNNELYKTCRHNVINWHSALNLLYIVFYDLVIYIMYLFTSQSTAAARPTLFATSPPTWRPDISSIINRSLRCNIPKQVGSLQYPSKKIHSCIRGLPSVLRTVRSLPTSSRTFPEAARRTVGRTLTDQLLWGIIFRLSGISTVQQVRWFPCEHVIIILREMWGKSGRPELEVRIMTLMGLSCVHSMNSLPTVFQQPGLWQV